ncbi:MAG: hypothetical protein JSU96_10375 [Acidobacteriota bacterium]|nr:MAG: hypothetical protein JSU96_10375 [Acidobacteriota bacterium]
MAERVVTSLDGTWELGQTISPEEPPESFDRTIVVPGLVDLAQPGYDEVGRKSELRSYFWYRKTFTLPKDTDRAVLKIHKAKYGAAVLLNGASVGEHLPCFTPALLDIGGFLKPAGQDNELIIRVGADRETLPEGQPGGWDFEKYLYIPGIYDSVEVIQAGFPFLENIQTVPDIEAGVVRVVTELRNGAEVQAPQLVFEVRERSSGQVVGRAETTGKRLAPGELTTLEVSVPIEKPQLWSPEHPFLYELKVSSDSDQLQTRFGMRSFRFDRLTGRAVLNGKPYFLRGSNVTIYRFFEDELRGRKPWDREWVRKLHRQFKSMHWNSLRYCIGFPPEFWYDIADEEGILLQDEFPIWLLNDAPEAPVAEKIIPEYVEWMRERWNHASVVMWDGQNESVTGETGKAIQAVRHLDLSNRPWDNGWADPQSPTDFVEAHPYLFIRDWSSKEPFYISELAQHSGVPNLQEAQKKYKVPVVINEYAWLWLQRNGEPTSLTQEIYKRILGEEATPDDRRELYARYLAALSEFWRAHRQAAGVLHFCGLGYSRAGDVPRPEGGATSDNFIDLERLEFEPFFEGYVRDAFNPLGVMVDFWNESITPGVRREIPVFVTNDLDTSWEGTVSLVIDREGQETSRRALHAAVGPLGQQVLPFEMTLPKEPGRYRISALLTDSAGKTVRSFRLFEVEE